MPYKYKKVGDKYVVYKKDSGERVGATAGNKEALRKYLAALHINAKEGVNEADEDQFQSKLQQIFKQNYKGFVSALGKFASDPKFRQFVQNTDTSKSNVQLSAIPVTKLIPTQNEIAAANSLDFTLTKPDAAAYALKGGTVKVLSPIIVFNGKFIVDGHHRWSQLYALNKDAKIVAYNFTNDEIKSPLDALKKTQLAIIGAGATKLPTASAKGSLNLLKADEQQVKDYVLNKITDPVVQKFDEIKKLSDKNAIADYITSNVMSLQSTSQPVPGAPVRDVMPQADAVPGGLQKTIATLKQGVPSVAETKNNLYNMKKTKEQILREYIRAEIRKTLKEEKAEKDYDKDGEVESPEAEFKGSRDKAIKKAMKKND